MISEFCLNFGEYKIRVGFGVNCKFFFRRLLGSGNKWKGISTKKEQNKL